jgi:hypothetical protein
MSFSRRWDGGHTCSLFSCSNGLIDKRTQVASASVAARRRTRLMRRRPLDNIGSHSKKGVDN